MLFPVESRVSATFSDEAFTENRNMRRKILEERMSKRTIRLTDHEYCMCVQFSNESAKSQQDIEFGQKSTAPRSIKEIARDNLIGKMAEVGVAKMLREDYQLHVPINYEIYPRGEWDDNDIEVNRWTIDIKSTRKGHYLLLEHNKVNFRREHGNLPDMIIMCRTPWNEDTDLPADQTVELIGCISLKKLLDPKSTFVYNLRAGECIPGTRSKLQAANYAVEFEDLSDIKKAMDYILSHERKYRRSCN